VSTVRRVGVFRVHRLCPWQRLKTAGFMEKRPVQNHKRNKTSSLLIVTFKILSCDETTKLVLYEFC